MASNLETTKKGYELFRQGDISTFVKDIVDATFTWVSPGCLYRKLYMRPRESRARESRVLVMHSYGIFACFECLADLR